MYAIVRMLFVVSFISRCHFLFSVYISVFVAWEAIYKMKASALTTYAVPATPLSILLTLAQYIPCTPGLAPALAV